MAEEGNGGVTQPTALFRRLASFASTNYGDLHASTRCDVISDGYSADKHTDRICAAVLRSAEILPATFSKHSHLSLLITQDGAKNLR